MLKILYRLLAISSLVLILSAAAGCSDATQSSQPVSQTPESSGALESNAANSGEPVVVENYNREIAFESVPQRVVVTNEHTAEIMLALGLEKHIVGVVRRDGRHVLPEYEAAYDQLHLIGNENPSLEVLLDLNPDFIYGRESSFAGKTPIESVENLEKYGMKVYIDTDSYSENSTIDMLYQDISNLGLIFQVEKRASELIRTLQEKAVAITSVLKPSDEKLRVLVFDAGGDNVFTAANWALQTRLIEMAGGENIFSDIEKNWANVSWEEVVQRDPQVIVINNYGTKTAEEKIREITEHASLKNVSAVQNNRFVVIPLDSVFAGVQNMNALEALAKGFYPELFK